LIRISRLLSLPALLALGVLLFLSLRALERNAPPAGAGPEATPRYELLNSEWIRTSADGSPQFIARAAQMSWYDDQSAQLRHAEVRALGGGSSPWRLTAPEGHLPAKSRDLLLSGTVLATGHWPDGSHLGFHTERMWVETVQRMLRTDADVALEGSGRSVMATGLAADFDGRNIRLLSNVRAQYEAQPQAPAAKPSGNTSDAPAL